MTHFAKVNSGTVEKVIVAEASFFDTFVDDSAGTWIETYPDKSKRKNFAGVGYTYDQTKDAFIPPQPFPSWILNETTYVYEAPTTYPNDGKLHDWDESTKSWKEMTQWTSPL